MYLFNFGYSRVGITAFIAAVFAGIIIASSSHAEDASRNPVSDPLDPTPYRTRTLQLQERAVPVSTGTEFNPAISVIADFTYAHFTEDLDAPPGFELGGDDHGHGHGVEEGFQLREVELTLSGTVDPYFDAMATFGFTTDEVEVEEAYVTTRMLPAGLQLKAGKFLSDVGYINKQHIHNWLFVDEPWMREYFFGEEGLNEVGVQVSWLPPTETYIRLGLEGLQGESEGVASYVGEDGFRSKNGPRLFTGFAKVAPDIGDHHALQLGAFGGFSRVYQREASHAHGDEDGELDHGERWDGDGWFGGFDLVYKYNGQGVMGHRNFVLQAEYIYRRLDLDYEDADEDHDEDDLGHGHDQRWKQDGLYVQAVYGFAPRWNAGLRLDVLGLINDGYEDGVAEDFGTSYRYTGQIAYAPTEFSRIRAQVSYADLAHDDHGDGHDEHNAWMFMLQYSMSLGVHGAHSF